MSIRDHSVGTAGVNVASLVVDQAALLSHVWGTNNSGSTIYIQFIDAASVPADGAVTLMPPGPITVGPGASFDIKPKLDILFNTGICIVASSTKATKTIVTACLELIVQYKAAV